MFAVTLFALNQPAVYSMLEIQPLFRVQDPFLYFSVWAFLVALTLVVVVSWLTPREPDEKLRFVVTRSQKGPST